MAKKILKNTTRFLQGGSALAKGAMMGAAMGAMMGGTKAKKEVPMFMYGQSDKKKKRRSR